MPYYQNWEPVSNIQREKRNKIQKEKCIGEVTNEKQLSLCIRRSALFLKENRTIFLNARICTFLSFAVFEQYMKKPYNTRERHRVKCTHFCIYRSGALCVQERINTLVPLFPFQIIGEGGAEENAEKNQKSTQTYQVRQHSWLLNCRMSVHVCVCVGKGCE